MLVILNFTREPIDYKIPIAPYGNKKQRLQTSDALESLGTGSFKLVVTNYMTGRDISSEMGISAGENVFLEGYEGRIYTSI